MRQGLTYVAPLLIAVGAITFAATACSSAEKRTVFETEPPKDQKPTEPGFTEGDTPCQGLECKRVTCDNGGTTTITGKVYDPAGANALYNVLVYIPGGPNGDKPLPPIANSLDTNVACETCAAMALDPMVSALTNTKGEFKLENVPVDKDVPVVVQIGKWRRQLKFDVSKKCEENKVPDREFRLPKNGSEGDMPHIAVTAGGCDALECLLRGIGVDDKEFVAGGDPSGHIHVFNGEMGEFKNGPLAGGTTADPFGGQLWNDVEKIKKFDMVMLSCECSENNQNKGGDVGRPGARQAMWDYANLGGRIFATHFHYTWFKNSPQGDWQGVANWNATSESNKVYDVDQTFPKGTAFAEWLLNVNASSTLGKIQLTDVTNSLSSVRPPAQSWIKQGDDHVRYFSFNTPTDKAAEEQCGRAVYSDLHLMGISAGGQEFPEGCPASGGLSAQQKALEFMFFDLAGCVQSDDTPPVIPK